MPLEEQKRNGSYGTQGVPEYILIRKNDAIELLKQLDGAKRKLWEVLNPERT